MLCLKRGRFGLSADPDVLHVPMTSDDKYVVSTQQRSNILTPVCHRVLILATDGVWDVISADEAINEAWNAYQAGDDPAQRIVDEALKRHEVSLAEHTFVIRELRVHSAKEQQTMLLLLC